MISSSQFIKDFKVVLEKLTTDCAVFKDNLFKNYEMINPDSESLYESIVKSGENIEDLEDKIWEYNLHESNQFGKKALESFKGNLLVAKQVTKILIYRITFYLTRSYFIQSYITINRSKILL